MSNTQQLKARAKQRRRRSSQVEKEEIPPSSSSESDLSESESDETDYGSGSEYDSDESEGLGPQNNNHAAAFGTFSGMLADHMKSRVWQHFKTLRVKTSNFANQKNLNKDEVFNKTLQKVPEWDEGLITKATEPFKKDMPFLLNVFQLTMAAYMMLQNTFIQNEEDTDLSVPEFNKFLHQVFIDAAEHLQGKGYLLDPECKEDPKCLKNKKRRESLMKDSIQRAINQVGLIIVMSELSTGEGDKQGGVTGPIIDPEDEQSGESDDTNGY